MPPKCAVECGEVNARHINIYIYIYTYIYTYTHNPTGQESYAHLGVNIWIVSGSLDNLMVNNLAIEWLECGFKSHS